MNINDKVVLWMGNAFDTNGITISTGTVIAVQEIFPRGKRFIATSTFGLCSFTIRNTEDGEDGVEYGYSTSALPIGYADSWKGQFGVADTKEIRDLISKETTLSKEIRSIEKAEDTIKSLAA